MVCHIVQRKHIATYPFRRMSARARFLRGVTGHWIPTRHTVLWSLILVKVRVCNVISTRSWCLQNRNKENYQNFSLIVSRIERLVNHLGKNDDIYVHDKRSVTLQRSTTFITMIRDTQKPLLCRGCSLSRHLQLTGFFSDFKRIKLSLFCSRHFNR